MLQTNLKHVESAAKYNEIINTNENVMICCGRMGPMCLPVYYTMEKLEGLYKHVKFYDMAFDNPDAEVVRNLPECKSFMSLPFIVYYKNGKVVRATAGLQNNDQISEILDREF